MFLFTLTVVSGLIAYLILRVGKDEVIKEFNPEDFNEPVNVAMIYTLLEMPDKAVECLEKGYRERSLMMVMLTFLVLGSYKRSSWFH